MKREDLVQHTILPDPSLSAVAELTENRQHPRVPVSIGVTIVEARTRVQITGRATDFGVGGCYVDTMNTLPQGTPVEVLLHWKEHTLHLRALVSYAVSGRSIGMGLAFTETSAEAGATLLDWVTGLGNQARRSQQPEPDRKTSEDEVQPAKEVRVDDIIGELVALLARKQLLTQLEANGLCEKIGALGKVNDQSGV